MAGCCENWFSLLNVFGFYFKFIFIIQILCSNWRQKDTPITYHHYAKVLSISYIYIFFFFFLIHRLPTKVGDPHGNPLSYIQPPGKHLSMRIPTSFLGLSARSFGVVRSFALNFTLDDQPQNLISFPSHDVAKVPDLSFFDGKQQSCIPNQNYNQERSLVLVRKLYATFQVRTFQNFIYM